MYRNVTAIYRSAQTAELVRQELEGLGISRGSIHVIPDASSGVTSAGISDTTRAAPGATAGMGDTTATGMGDTTATGMDDTTGMRDTTTTGMTDDSSRHFDAIDDLNLPDDDAQTYKHCIRQGDYVVSAEVDDEQVARVQELMRRPESEAHNIDTRRDEFSTADPVAAREGRTVDEERRGARDAAHEDAYTRSYTRGSRLEDRKLD
ncbi:hypothetical protein BH23PSE1_BH23PSE1_05970 [soil metagenome]